MTPVAFGVRMGNGAGLAGERQSPQCRASDGVAEARRRPEENGHLSRKAQRGQDTDGYVDGDGRSARLAQSLRTSLEAAAKLLSGHARRSRSAAATQRSEVSPRGDIRNRVSRRRPSLSSRSDAATATRMTVSSRMSPRRSSVVEARSPFSGPRASLLSVLAELGDDGAGSGVSGVGLVAGICADDDDVGDVARDL